MGSFKTLKNFFIKHKWYYVLGVIWLLVVDIVQLIVPQILRRVTNLLENDLLNMQDLVKYAIYIVLTGIVVGLGRYFWRIYIQGTSRRLEYYLRNKFFRHLQSLSTNYFNRHKTGDLMAHATNDINAVRMAMGFGVVMITDSIFMTIAALTMMIITTNVKLTLLALLPLPFLAFTVSKFGKMIHHRFKLVQESFSNLSDKVQENFAGIRVVKSFVQEDQETEKFTKANQENFDMNMHLIKVWGIFDPFIQFVSSISFLIVIWYGGILVISGDISLGDFIAFIGYLGLLVWPMIALGWVINLMQRGAASMERLNAVLDEEPEILDRKDVIKDFELKGNVELKDVSFKYPESNDYALRHINLTIPKGSTLGIVGRTGSGKTTLVNLLLRLYNIQEGQILVDGVDIHKVPLKTLRENIGYVSQDNFLFSSTIKGNIAFAYETEVSDERVIEAAKAAELYDNVMDFPDKFETSLGERGVTLSGGQRQRTAIARSIIKDPKILILDDSLSAVDTETEEKILSNLENILTSKTNIIIAHRISTVKDAEQIIVIDEGEITEQGTHEELLAIDGIYKDMYEKQLLEEKIRNE